MHGLTFEMKRAHVAAYRFAFDEFQAHAVGANEELFEKMTPARFDMMFLLHESQMRGYPRVLQSKIWQRLGLHRSTISKGISAMVACGYVVRDYLDGIERRPSVMLTKKGYRAIRMALGIVFTQHRLRTQLEAFFDRRFVRRGPRGRFQRDAMNCFLSRIAGLGRSFCRHFRRPEADVVFPIDPESEL